MNQRYDIIGVGLSLFAVALIAWTGIFGDMKWIIAREGIPSWIQAIGSLIAIAVAIYVPNKIQANDFNERRKERSSYRILLREAFESLREPIAYIETAYEFGIDKAVNAGNDAPAEIADQLDKAIEKMQDTLSVVRQIEDVNKLDRYGAVLEILKTRRLIENVFPDFEREQRILRAHGDSKNVVRIAIAKLSERSCELRNAVDRVLHELSEA